MTMISNDPLIGKKVFQYEFLALLGRGGIGAVYKARHTILQEIRAIKVLRSEYVSDKDLMERFIFEAKTLTKLNHPNLARLYEFFKHDDDRLFMVMEFVQGITLHEYSKKRGPLAEDEVIEISIQICQGLVEIHNKGIVHRDISPDNIMILTETDGQKKIKMIDFGIAKEAFSSSGFTHTGMFVGKFFYSSPEQAGALEEGETLDARSDIYSLGVVMYELLTGTLPFKSMTPQSYLIEQMKGKPRPFRQHELIASVSKPFETIVYNCLRKDRKKRIKSTEEVLLRLEEIQKKRTKAGSRFVRSKEEAKTLIINPGQPAASKDQEKSDTSDTLPDTIQAPNIKKQQTEKGRLLQRGILGVALVLGLLFLITWLVRPGDKEEINNVAEVTEKVIVETEEKVNVKVAGELKVLSIPSDAQVFVNDQPTGKRTPCSLDSLTAGEYRVLARKEGYLDKEVTATLKAGESVSQTLTLEIMPPVEILAKLIVDTSPSGATVSLDGRRQEKVTPLVIDDLHGGRTYLVKFEKDGYSPYEEELALIEGDNTPDPFSLEPLLGSFQIDTDPPGASIYLDDKALKKLTPALIEDVALFVEHKIELKKEGFRSEIKPATLNTTDTENINVVMAALPKGRYNVISSPSRATVFFNGRKLKKKTPLWINDIILNKASDIRVVKTGYLPWKKSFSLDQATEKPIYVKLKRAYGKLMVTTEPPVTVFLDKRPRGTTPLELAKVPAGSHVLRLIKAEVGIDEEIPIEVKTGKQLTHDSKFSGYLSIPDTTRAQVFLDDQLIGKTPMKGKELIVGHYRLRLEYKRGLSLRSKQEKEYKIFIVNNKTLTIQ